MKIQDMLASNRYKETSPYKDIKEHSSYAVLGGRMKWSN